MRRKSSVRNKYIKEHPDCELCGCKATEVHHKNPVVVGGSDNFDNMISLCDSCHDEIHKRGFTRSELSKIGLSKCKEKYSEPMISLIELYKLIWEAEKYDRLDAVDILDIIDRCPVRGHYRYGITMNEEIESEILNFN